ncbi:hypothetical protein KR054_010338 [Drosophila jambulina]|nr:hypothetical protein KR054_010338 [Drosophila jambulina]
MRLFVLLISLWTASCVLSLENSLAENQFSPRILVSGIKDVKELPIYVVKGWFNELGLIQLKSQILQVKYRKDGLLFELKTAVQAKQVVDTWQKNEVLSGLKAIQTNIDFFDDLQF